jgi:inhibitor of KinA sporulation pathway (predicted exonuclease)
MTTTKKFLSIDLELNQPSNKIIQVGVAIGSADQTSDDYVVKKWYIDPEEKIDKFIIGLTGITDSDIRSYCVSHDTVARELTELIVEHQPWLNAVVWGYDDAGVLRKEFERRSVDFRHLGGRWIDLKTIYNFLAFSTDTDPRGDLRSSMSRFNCVFDGEQHRADVDAKNTLKFFFHLMRQQNKMFDLLENNSYNNE